ncbi:tyrosine-protein phosphatase [Paenibacillus sp. LjRoot56]|uniref:tyrosine-protein phosphatase n=1 Tax=Paenibacillus sp. LjRoot56 TaxID=3342333 RepID=UPI003ECFCDBC
MSVITAERKVNVKGLDNFRDLGGYRTEDGRTVKWGKLFRANELAALTENDKQIVQDLGIRTDIDFRSQGEVAQKPDPKIPGMTYVWDPVMKDLGNSTDITQLFKMDYASMMAMMEDGQRNMVSDPQVQAYKTMFELLKDPSNGAIVYHCTAGKDRTGLGSALILLALGVDEKTIMQDYLLSNDYRAAGNQATLKYMAPMMTTEDSKKIATSILGVESEWLQASLDEIKKQYGTYNAFFEKALGVTTQDLEELKALYLEAPGTYAPSFGDIIGHWAQKDIELLASESIVSGVNDLAFAPNRSITRAEFSTLLVRALKLPTSAASSGFQDVADGDWYAAPVSAAVKAKLITGYDNHNFKPGAPITREELSAMLVRALQASGASTTLSAESEKSALAKFKDSSSIVWARPEMAAALQSGLVNGLDGDLLSPAVPATRAQAATMLERFLQLTKKS